MKIYENCPNELLELFKIKKKYYMPLTEKEHCTYGPMTLLGLSINKDNNYLVLEFEDQRIKVNDFVIGKDYFMDNYNRRIYFSEKKCVEYLLKEINNNLDLQERTLDRIRNQKFQIEEILKKIKKS